MSIDELGKRELDLYSKLCKLTGTIEDKIEQLDHSEITEEYKQIHSEYSRIAKKEGEALKRALFIMWYAVTEPIWLTGIGELDFEAEVRVVKLLNRRLGKNVSDYELDWMLAYYADFTFVFERFADYEHFYKRVSTKTGIAFPGSIDKRSMANRGLMGVYFLSLNWQ
ncbi:MAG: hypothetical protein AAGA66_00485 [Bacteroidota bacterium]